MNNHSTNPLPAMILSLFTPCLLAACGEDRSGEVPLAPTVETLSAEQTGDSVLLTGRVTASPNSALTECGFEYDGEQSGTAKSDTAIVEFSAYTDSLAEGDYYAVAYATNGMGTSYGDTIYFTVSR